jgi:fatty-acyl-CoA synthase
VELRIVDPETGAPRPTGEPGEIAVKGPTLMRGYDKVAPEDTFDRDGFFHTGDAGFLDPDGYLHFTGRLTSVIKTGGANVSPLEVERALAGYPGLLAAHVVGVPHPTLGEAVVLCAVRADGAEVSGDAIRAFLQARLSAYKIPRRVLWFQSDELPLTATEKIRVGALRQAALTRIEKGEPWDYSTAKQQS